MHTKLIPLWFSHVDLPPLLQISTIIDLFQILEISSYALVYHKNSDNSAVSTSLPSSKTARDSPSGQPVLCILKKLTGVLAGLVHLKALFGCLQWLCANLTYSPAAPAEVIEG